MFDTLIEGFKANPIVYLLLAFLLFKGSGTGLSDFIKNLTTKKPVAPTEPEPVQVPSTPTEPSRPLVDALLNKVLPELLPVLLPLLVTLVKKQSESEDEKQPE